MFLQKSKIKFFSLFIFVVSLLMAGSTVLSAATEISLGKSVKLSLSAQGTAPFSYQWYKDDSAIGGATGPTFTIGSMRILDVGVYYGVVSNSAGSTSSGKVTLISLSLITVPGPGTSAPAFTTQPVSQAVAPGGSVVFTSTANGSPAPSYQWRKDGANIGGATGSSYSLTGISSANAGRYTVVATNSAGSATSNAATLTIGGSVVAGKAGADFSGDGRSDVLMANVLTGQHSIWNMAGTQHVSTIPLDTVTPDWQIFGIGDFNGDGRPDVLWQNINNGRYGLWLMNGTAMSSWLELGTVPSNWKIEGVGDFNGDGRADVIWRNTSTNECSIRLMNGTTDGASVSLGVVDAAWHVAGTADFDGDGKTDILWESTAQSGFGLWLMNGTSFSRWVNLGALPTDWRIGGTGDYNGDGRPDILWQNTKTGECRVWLMSGTTRIGDVFLENVSPEWIMAN